MNPSNLIAVDVETSGLNPFKHQLLAVGLSPLRETIAPVTVFVRHTAIVWSSKAKEYFERYRSAWERGAVYSDAACTNIEDYFARVSPNRPVQLVGHNIAFDMGFLKQLAMLAGKDELDGMSHRALDTHTMLYILSQRGVIPASAATSDGAFKHFDIHVDEAVRHTAIGDAMATRDLTRAVFKLYEHELHSAHSREDALANGH